MALIKCTECGKEFSDKASACPNCGCPISEIVGTTTTQSNVTPQYQTSVVKKTTPTTQIQYKQCKKCGVKMGSSQTICVKCGTDQNAPDKVEEPLVTPTTSTTSNNYSSSNNKQNGSCVMTIAKVIATFLAIYLALVIMLPKRPSEDKKNYDSEPKQEQTQTQDKEESKPKEDITEYKKSCKEIAYNDILRKPDYYDGSRCKVVGIVSQAIEGFLNSVTLYIEDEDGNKWECFYTYSEGATHILADDKIMVYGECEGTTNATTLLGDTVTLPSVTVKYVVMR